jgi:hypothetical protein
MCRGAGRITLRIALTLTVSPTVVFDPANVQVTAYVQPHSKSRFSKLSPNHLTLSGVVSYLALARQRQG